MMLFLAIAHCILIAYIFHRVMKWLEPRLREWEMFSTIREEGEDW